MAARHAAAEIDARVVWPEFAVLHDQDDRPTDFNDLHVAEGLEAVRRQVLAVVKPPAAGGWKDMLARSESGALIAHMQNVELILANDERWAGVISYSAFSSKIVKLRAAPYGGGTGDCCPVSGGAPSRPAMIRTGPSPCSEANKMASSPSAGSRRSTNTFLRSCSTASA